MTTFSHFIHNIAYMKALLEQGFGWPVQVITDKHQQIGSETPPSEWMTSIYDFSNLHPYPQIKFSPANEAFIFVTINVQFLRKIFQVVKIHLSYAIFNSSKMVFNSTPF